MNRKTISSKPQSIVAAAALQQHITQSTSRGSSYPSIPGESRPFKSKYPLSLRQRQLKKWQRGEQIQSRISHEWKGKEPLGSKDADVILQEKQPRLSLAQKMGLIPGIQTPLSLDEWKGIKEKCIQRGDFSYPCPVCQEGFHIKQQVILSCSHVFHQDCIESYERFIQQKACPICRTSYNGKLLTTEGIIQARQKAAIRIQSAWRGYRTRQWYWSMRDLYPPKDPRILFKFNMRRISRKREKMEQQSQQSRTMVETFLGKLDQEMQNSRHAMEKLIKDLTLATATTVAVDPVPWETVYQKAFDRKYDHCAICLNQLNLSTQGRKRALALLSCTHVFHESCICSFEKYGSSKTCPICRVEYKKVSL